MPSKKKSSRSQLNEFTLFKDEYQFAATFLRLAFAIYFIFVAVKKLRLGYAGFADMLVNPPSPTLISQEIPAILLYLYGLLLPGLELIAGVFLLLDTAVRSAYTLIAVMYLTFIFGQMYNGNTGIIGTDYLPSMVALILAYFTYERASEGVKKKR